MGKEVVHGILFGLAAIVVTVTLGSFAGQLYSSLAHHGGGHGGHGGAEKHSSEGGSGAEGTSHGEKGGSGGGAEKSKKSGSSH